MPFQEQSAPPPPDAPQIPTPAPAPAPAQATGTPSVQVITEGASANAVYEAQRAARRELRSQLEQLESRRSEISERLEDPMVGGADRRGLEQRITEIDGRISALEAQIAAADAAVAQAAAVPGAVVPDRPPPRDGPPEEAFVLGGMFIVVVMLPLSIAYARRIWRRGAAIASSIPKEWGERFMRLEQAVDAIAVEVERVGEGQRFLTRTMTEQGSRALGAGQAPMDPIAVREREAVPARDRGQGR